MLCTSEKRASHQLVSKTVFLAQSKGTKMWEALDIVKEGLVIPNKQIINFSFSFVLPYHLSRGCLILISKMRFVAGNRCEMKTRNTLFVYLLP